jgi:hypothetical protein
MMGYFRNFQSTHLMYGNGRVSQRVTSQVLAVHWLHALTAHSYVVFNSPKNHLNVDIFQ